MAALACAHRTHFGTPPHTLRGPIGSSTEGPSARVHMRTRVHFVRPLTRFVAPLEAPPKAPVAGPARGFGLSFAHPSHASWPHKGLHRRSQWLRSHAATAFISAHLSHASWPHRELHRRPQWAGPYAVRGYTLAQPSRGSWFHRELHRRPQWQRQRHLSRGALPMYEEMAISSAIHSCIWLGPSPG